MKKAKTEETEETVVVSKFDKEIEHEGESFEFIDKDNKDNEEEATDAASKKVIEDFTPI